MTVYAGRLEVDPPISSSIRARRTARSMFLTADETRRLSAVIKRNRNRALFLAACCDGLRLMGQHAPHGQSGLKRIAYHDATGQGQLARSASASARRSQGNQGRLKARAVPAQPALRCHRCSSHSDDARATRRAGWSERFYRLPELFLPDPLASIIEKELRSLVRTPRFRLALSPGLPSASWSGFRWSRAVTATASVPSIS